VTGWAPSGTTQIVGVQRYPAAAALVDSTYTMSYANSRNLLGNGRA
jgi:hypothetical protein